MQDQQINVISVREHIRRRPAMYIKNLRIQGFCQLLEYLFEDLLKTACEQPVVELAFYPGNKLLMDIRGCHSEKINLQLAQVHNSGTALEGLGWSVFTALSSDITITLHVQPSVVVYCGYEGKLEVWAATSQEKENSVQIDYTLDETIFGELEWEYESINRFFRQFAVLNPGVKIISSDKTTDEVQRAVFHYPTGVFRRLDQFCDRLYETPRMRLNIEATIGAYSYRIALAYATQWIDPLVVETYANNIHTFEGGSLLEGILDGMTESIRDFGKRENRMLTVNRKRIKKYLLLIAVVRGEDFSFHGSIRSKLDMPALRKDVKRLVAGALSDHLLTNGYAKAFILDKFAQ